jgi:hypothetical protein
MDFSGSLAPEDIGLAERRLRLLAEFDLGLSERLLSIAFDFAAEVATESDRTEQRHARLANALLHDLAAYFDSFALAAGIPDGDARTHAARDGASAESTSSTGAGRPLR